MRTWCYSSFSLISLNILITCLQKMYGYYREKFQVNHLWELRVKSWLLPVDRHLQDLLLPSVQPASRLLHLNFTFGLFFAHSCQSHHWQLLMTKLIETSAASTLFYYWLLHSGIFIVIALLKSYVSFNFHVRTTSSHPNIING